MKTKPKNAAPSTVEHEAIQDTEMFSASLREGIKQEEEKARLTTILEITPALMARVTGYSESVCKKVLYDVYPNKDITDFINQQTSIFLRRIKTVLYNTDLWDAIDGALEWRKIRSAEHLRLFVELQNINKTLTAGK
jgi:hypothetical protein